MKKLIYLLLFLVVGFANAQRTGSETLLVSQQQFANEGGAVEIASDNFNRANENIRSGPNWGITVDEGDQPSIVSNELKSNGSGDAAAIWVGDTFDNDQYAEVRWVSGAGNFSGIMVRADATSYYLAQEVGNTIQLGIVDGGYTAIGSSVSHTFIANDVLRLEIVGTTLTVKINDSTVITETDSNLASGATGVLVSGSSVLDDWSAGNIN